MKWIAFEADPRSLLTIPVLVNGVAASAILDTGATRTVLCRNFVGRLGIALRGGFLANGLTARLTGSYADNCVLQIGDRPLISLDAAVLDLSTIQMATGRPVDVVLGLDFFKTAIVEIDFPSARLRLWARDADPGQFGSAASFRVSPDGLLELPLRIGRRTPISAAMDLGSNVPLYLSPELAKKDNLLEGLASSTCASAGAEGLGISRIATLPALDFADASLRHVPAQVPGRWRFRSAAIVGLPVLRHFRVVLCLGASNPWLACDLTAPETCFPKDRSGIGATLIEDRLRIIHIASGSPAERAGLAAGDEIVAIDGRIVTAASVRTGIPLGQKPAGTRMILTFANGETRDLVLEDYF